MLSSFLAKRAILARSTMISSTRSFSLSATQIQQTLKDPAHQNWTQFFSTVKASDVAGSDVASVGHLLKALTYAANAPEA